ncbi:alpha-amylase family glycosyl hydrolase [Effusibacillus consociatus]|uniref:Alpha-amylase family glycosyl hydrolase n=1 Tax=Effusibacillus consociatus TaxID=1117041 RepID=A0ABV9Q5Y1_9BACL
MKRNLRKPFKFFSALLASFLTFGNLIPVQTVHAVPDTSVSNAVNFSTDVIYQVVTDRFADGNPANNPTGALFDGSCTNLKKYCGGDWQGIINKINDGYLTGMGVTSIWISQPVENIYAVLNDTAGSTSYHGYWARDFKKTNPYFGSFTDFDNLIATAHSKGIKVIIDFAPNHTSPASETNPSYADNGKLYDNGALLGGYTNDTNKYFHHNGGTDFSTYEDGIYRNLFDLADFNHQNNTIDSYLKTAIKLWLDKGIDGIRVDAVKHMPFGWQKNWMDTVYSHRPVFTFGEWFLGTNEVDSKNHYFANESGMSLLDFRFGQTVREVFRDNVDTMYGLDAMIQGTNTDYDEVNDQVTFIDNHDMDRFSTGSNNRKVEQALAFTLTSRGVPAIYYGTEQYMTGNGDPNNRAKMTSFSTTTTAYNVIKKLAPLRKSNPAIAYGSTAQRWINNDVYVYERKFGNNVALVAMNRSSTAGYDLTGLYTALPAGTYTDVLAGLLNGNNIGVASDGSVTAFNLGPGEVGVWQYTASASAPVIGHVGPMMGQAGQTITVDGRGFGTTAGQVLFGTSPGTIVSWEDTQVKVKIPSIAAGKHNITLKTSSGVTSNVYDKFEVLSGNQVSVRFVVNNANTVFGENVYLVGNVSELGNWNTANAIGPIFNQVVYQYPTWYYDVSVPAGTPLEFKFIKKNGSTVTWEGGSNHTYTSPASGTGTVIVNWQP